MRCWSERCVLVRKFWTSFCLRWMSSSLFWLFRLGLGPRLGGQDRVLGLLVELLVFVHEGLALLVELLDLFLGFFARRRGTWRWPPPFCSDLSYTLAMSTTASFTAGCASKAVEPAPKAARVIRVRIILFIERAVWGLKAGAKREIELGAFLVELI